MTMQSTEQWSRSDDAVTSGDTYSLKSREIKLHLVMLEGGQKLSPSESVKKMEKSAENPWDDVVLNPHNWLDNRMAKLKGLLHPKFPDFKHNETQKALWLDGAPCWVSAKLDGLVFRTTRKGEKSDRVLLAQEKGKYIQKSGEAKQENENLWKSLVDNPIDWWDNRANKFNQKSPDFKHKKTGVALWLSSTTPQWVLANLPPANTEEKFERRTSSSPATLLS
ncbi:single-stranded dna binding protein [Musa troglodytarum]|uniref:Single-stranded dna binding protein n=1 Tax=Musa troglodytarum TaxID=320322 RepID=A0A9E7G1A2_9LILI|nr:single-stranded dna binding protein [Musa troglodytarum]